MKKYIVIGNPIDHSLSPKLHNYWFKANNINAEYHKKLAQNSDLMELIKSIRKKEFEGANITVPFKNEIIDFLDELSPEANVTKSVNTLLNQRGKIIGHNTDIAGFELAIRHTKYDLSQKNILILGAGGVVPSIVYALEKSKVKKITIMNRTIEKAEILGERFKNIEVKKWGSKVNFDMIINATSIGLSDNDKIDLKFEDAGENKFFYDVIYNPTQTNFLKEAKKNLHKTENGKMMFIYQAHQAFTLWHKKMPDINDEVINLIK